MIFKQTVINDINRDIVANGNGLITGNMMNNVLKNMVNITPEPFFRYPKEPGLLEQHIGSLVMNQDGFAALAMLSGDFSGIKGKWKAEPQGGAIPYSPGTPGSTSSPREIYVYYNTGTQPSDGDTFALTLSNGNIVTYTFRIFPLSQYEVKIGVNAYESVNNLCGNINSSPEAISQGVYATSGVYYGGTSYYGSITYFIIKDNIPNEGLYLNVNYGYGSSFFTSSMVTQYGAQGYYGSPGNNNYLYNGFMWANLQYQGNYYNTYAQYEMVFSINAPSGIVQGGFKYPQNKTEYADNLVWMLNNLTMYGPTGVVQFTDFFKVTRQGDIVYIEQLFPTDMADVGFYYISEAPLAYKVETKPEPARAPYMRNPILGVLVGIDGNMALVDNRDVVKVRLAKKVRFQVLSNNPIGFPANIFYRLLKPVDNGNVVPIYPDNTMNDIIDDLSPYYSGNGYSGDFDFFRINSTMLYEAIEEGNAGDSILARRFTFLAPNQSNFNAYGYGYDYGYYYGNGYGY